MKLFIGNAWIYFFFVAPIALCGIFYLIGFDFLASALFDFIKIQFSLGFFKVVTEPLATRRFQQILFEAGSAAVLFIDRRFPEFLENATSEEEVKREVLQFLKSQTDINWDRLLIPKEQAVYMAMEKAMEIWRPDIFIGKMTAQTKRN